MSKLKEAAEARANNDVPMECPPMLRADCPPYSNRYSNLPLAALIVMVMSLSAFMAWKWFHADRSELTVRARSVEFTPASAPTPAPPTQSAAAPVTPEPVAPVTPAVAPAAPANPVSEAKPAAVEATTNFAAVVAEPQKPAPINYKLQGILFEPGRSSAVINGKTVCVGERVGDSRVWSIDKETVVLINSTGETNLLELP